MKRLYIILVLALFVSCSKHREIPPEILEKIVEESVLASSTVSNSQTIRNRVENMDYYTPVLDKYGYKVEDLEFTLQKMVARKTEILKVVIMNARQNIKSEKQHAEYLYDIYDKTTTAVGLLCRDTLYKVDTLISLKLAKNIDKENINLPLDGNGDYKLEIKYETTSKKNPYTVYMGFEVIDTLCPYFSGFKKSDSYMYGYSDNKEDYPGNSIINFKVKSPKEGNNLKVNLFTLDRIDRGYAIDNAKLKKNKDIKIKVLSVILTKSIGFVEGSNKLLRDNYGLKLFGDYMPQTEYFRAPYLHKNIELKNTLTRYKQISISEKLEDIDTENIENNEQINIEDEEGFGK